MSLEVTILPLLKDNYAYFLRDAASGRTAVVDPSEAAGVTRAIERRGGRLDFVLNTHHHWDHTDGNEGLKEKYGCLVIGPEAERERIAALDVGLKDGDAFKLGGSEFRALHVPGHTAGHMALWFEADDVVFTGDTLFSLGCGRLFEGTSAQMVASLARLAALPPTTRVYCGHEYTEANGRFAATIEPDNAALQERLGEVAELRRAGRPTLPSTIRSERACNPFIQMALKADTEGFAALRDRKDKF